MPWELYDPENVVFFGGSDADQTRWVYNFNGVDSYINAGQIPLSGSFNIDATVNLMNVSTEQWIYGDWNSGAQSVALRVSSGQVQFFISPNGLISESVSTPISTGVSRIRCGLVAGDSIFVDVNGAEVRQVTARTGVFASGQNVLFGRKNGSSFYLSGQIYNVKINDGSAYSYPINDRTFGAGAVIANTGTGPDATGVNLLESGWTEIPL